jgi:hypothetical protein
VTRRIRVGGALVLASAALAVGAQPAAAKITFTGIGDIKLGMTGADVRETLGDPSSTEPVEQGAAADWVELNYPRRKFEVLVDEAKDRVVAIKTTSRSQRTSARLGVGSALSTVRRKLKGEDCSSNGRTYVCSVIRRGALMSFELKRGKVIEVAIADLST